jgi:hypothetical protein
MPSRQFDNRNNSTRENVIENRNENTDESRVRPSNNDNVLEKNYRNERIETPRQENRTPVFQPRNEPRQYRQETPSAPQSQPHQNGGGRRR